LNYYIKLNLIIPYEHLNNKIVFMFYKILIAYNIFEIGLCAENFEKQFKKFFFNKKMKFFSEALFISL